MQQLKRISGGVSAEVAGLCALVFFGLTFPTSIGSWFVPVVSISVLAGTIGAVLSFFKARGESLDELGTLAGLVGTIPILFLFLSLSFGAFEPLGSYAAIHVLLLVGAIGWLWAARAFDWARRWSGWIVTAATVAALLGMGAWLIQLEPPFIDVLLAHEAAADDLREGLNPYVSTQVPNTSPLPGDPETIDGYPYSPAVLITYSSADWLLGDPRWATVVSLACFIVVLVRPWRHSDTTGSGIRAALALAVVAMPATPALIFNGWTDALALPLLLLAADRWATRPLAASVFLGLAFATKEYFILALPLLLLFNDRFRRKRMMTVAMAVGATYLPFVLAGEAFPSDKVERVASSGYRRDSNGLAGIGIDVPRWLSLGLSFGFSAYAGAQTKSVHQWFLGLAAVLAVAFVTGFQSFSNYWFLVSGVIVVALAIGIPADQSKSAVSVSPEVDHQRSRLES